MPGSMLHPMAKFVSKGHVATRAMVCVPRLLLRAMSEFMDLLQPRSVDVCDSRYH